MNLPPKYQPIQNYLNAQGQVTIWPSKRNHFNRQKLILEFLAEQFDFDRQYTEKEVNEILNHHHTFADHALLRRELFSNKLLNRTRDGRAYWRCNITTASTTHETLW